MAAPIYDTSVRTTVVALGGAMVQLVPPVGATGTARMVRLRLVSISNTTAVGFGVGLGLATAAAVTPSGNGIIVKRSPLTAPTPVASIFSAFVTTPTAPTGFSIRLWVPGNSTVIWVFQEGEELTVPPSATPLPFCVFSTGVGQIADITLTWTE